MRCSNCNYILVLISRRRKYKCAKCSGLYFKKEVEDKDFQESNIRQRKEDIKNIHPRMHSQRKFRKNNPEKLKEYRSRYYEKHKKRTSTYNKKYYHKNKERLKLTRKEYYQKNKTKPIKNNNWAKLNREKHLENCRNYYLRNKEILSINRKIKRLNDLERARLLSKISYWRIKQKELTVEMLEKSLVSVQ